MSVFAKPPVVTWLPTRRCNLRCEYCRIRDNQFDELTEEDVYRVIAVLKRHFSDSFIVILGGDVTVWGKKRLKRFVKHLGDLSYAIVTNGMLLDEQYIRELKACGLKNLSLSADPMGCQDRARKTSNALRVIEVAKRLGVEDLHATLTLDRENYKGATMLVKLLSKEGCWSEITPYIAYPSHDYDFGFYDRKFAFRMSDWHALNAVMKRLVRMKREGYLIHNTSEYLLKFASNVCPDEYRYRCLGMTNLVIDADGTLRPCLHLRGNKIRRYNVLEWASVREIPFGRIHLDWKHDFKAQCHGCYWNCQVETEWVYKKYKHLGVDRALKKVQDYFQHRSD